MKAPVEASDVRELVAFSQSLTPCLYTPDSPHPRRISGSVLSMEQKLHDASKADSAVGHFNPQHPPRKESHSANPRGSPDGDMKTLIPPHKLADDSDVHPPRWVPAVLLAIWASQTGTIGTI